MRATEDLELPCGTRTLWEGLVELKLPHGSKTLWHCSWSSGPKTFWEGLVVGLRGALLLWGVTGLWGVGAGGFYLEMPQDIMGLVLPRGKGYSHAK